jgi:hypothetical protein
VSRSFRARIIGASFAALAGACSLTTSLTGFSNGKDDSLAGAEGGLGEAGADTGAGSDGPLATDAPASTDAAGTSAYAAAVLADKPMLYYRLGEKDVAGKARDSSSAGRAATFKGSVVCGVPGAIAGDVDTACRFDNNTTAVFLADGPKFTGLLPYSLEAWARPTNVQGAGGHVVAACEQEPNDGYAMFFYQGAAPRWERETPAGTDTTLAPPISLSGYVHLVGTYDGTTLRLYVDGALASNSPSTKTYPGSHGQPFSIGANSNADTNYFEGDIDEVALYDHVLSPARIKAHHDIGKGMP